MSNRARSFFSFVLAALVIIGAFAALILGRATWEQCLLGVAVAFGAVGLYHSPAPGQPGPAVSLLLGVLLLASCEFQGARWSIGHGAPQAIGTDAVQLTPKPSYSCPSGLACLWTSNVDQQMYLVDAAGVQTKVASARALRTSSNCAGLSGPLAGDTCYDTSLGVFRGFNGSTWISFGNDALAAHLAGSEIFTGPKTWNASQTTTDNSYTWGDATHRWQLMGLIKHASGGATAVTEAGVADGGSAIVHKVNNTVALTTSGARLVSWQNNSVEKAALLYTGGLLAPTVGPSASQQHTLPAVSSSTVAVLGAPQTWTQAQTFSAAPVINANPSGSFVVQKANGGTGQDNSGGVAQNAFWGGPAGASGAASYRALALADLPSGSTTGLPIAVVTAGASTAIAGGATAYLVAPGIAASSATMVRLAMPPIAFTVRNLHCVADTLPGGTETLACKVRRQVGGSGALSDTTVSTPACTDAIFTANTCEDTTHSQANAAGTALVLECTQSAGSLAAGVTCGFVVTL